MSAHIGDPNGLAVVEQHTEQAKSLRKVTDRSSLLLGYASRNELKDLALAVHHRYGRVLRLHQLPGELDEAAKQPIEAEL
jgi:hypothetical protein